MSQDVNGKFKDSTDQDRRDFLRRAGKIGLGVPTTALLLSVTSKNAKAWGYGYKKYDYDPSKIKKIMEYIRKYHSGQY